LYWIAGRNTDRFEIEELQFHIIIPDYFSIHEKDIAYFIARGQLNKIQLQQMHININFEIFSNHIEFVFDHVLNPIR
jgi:hypothetical protein